MRAVKQARIVVGYPNDALPGRQALSEVRELPMFRTLESELSIGLEIIAWDTHSGPGIHPDGGQGRVDIALKIEEADLFVAIFFQALGTPYSKSTTSETFLSGTVYELETAIEAWRKRGSPQIWLCFPKDFRGEQGAFVQPSPGLANYINLVKSNPSKYPLFYLEYSAWSGLKDRFEQHLSTFAIDCYNKNVRREAPAHAHLFYSANAHAVDVAAEAFAVPIADVEISLVLASGSESQMSWHGSLMFSLNTKVTSPVENGFSSAALTVFMSNSQTGSWDQSGRVLGKIIGTNTLSFNVALHSDKKWTHARLLISGVLANANDLSVSTADVYIVSQIALVSFGTSTYNITAGNLECRVGKVEPALAVTFGHRWYENDPGEKVRGPEPRRVDGVLHNVWETDVYISARALSTKFLRLYASAGRVVSQTTRISGIRVILRIYSLPERSFICVKRELPSDMEGYGWYCVGTDVNGAGVGTTPAGDPVKIEGNELIRLPISNGCVTTVYELRSVTAGNVFNGCVPGEFALAICSDLTLSQPPFDLSVRCSFAPLSTVTTPSATAPVPRFADTSTEKKLAFRNP